MLITNLEGTLVGEYWKLFPNTSFPAAGPSQAWLEMNGPLSRSNLILIV